MGKKRDKTESIEYALVRGHIKSGHGVASGKGKDERYPEGTLKQQFKHLTKEDHIQKSTILELILP